MSSLKRKSPWFRDLLPLIHYTDDGNPQYVYNEVAFKRPRFNSMGSINVHLDIHTKRATLKVAPSVVSLVSYSGDKEIFQASGTIIECDSSHRATVLTSANLVRRPTREDFMDNTLADNLKILVHVSGGRSYAGEIHAYDFNYNLVAIMFQADTPLPVAMLTPIDDSMSIDMSLDKSFLRPNSSTFNLVPGDPLIAVGRYFLKEFDIMAAPGEYRLDRSEYDCQELLMVTCRITRCGDGGPVVNLSGEVIGMTFYDLFLTPVLPINVVCKWWDHFKKHGKHNRPSLGMQLTNLYVAGLNIIEMVVQKFPNICRGVLVEKALPGSLAFSAGIRPNDVIIEFDGKPIQGFLEFFEMMWEKVGEGVELVVVREDHDIPIRISMKVANQDEVNRWSRWDYGPTSPTSA